MEEVVKFTEDMVKGLVNNPDIVRVQDFTDDDEAHILEVIVHNDDMSALIGKGGNMARAIKTLVQAAAYKKGIHKIRVNIDSI